jgi:predicted anti-sigma-YlaC factor YlaD
MDAEPTRTCRTVREALSAHIDGERHPLPDVEVERHLDGCRDCTTYLDGVVGLGRQLRVGEAVEVPDLTAPILVALAEDRQAVATGWTSRLRGLVALAGAVQLALALPALLGVVGPDVHLGRDLAALQLALGVGFLVAAWQPSRAAGLLPVAVVVGVVTVITAGVDVAAGNASLGAETAHISEIVGVLALWALRRRVPYGPLPMRAGAEPA